MPAGTAVMHQCYPAPLAHASSYRAVELDGEGRPCTLQSCLLELNAQRSIVPLWALEHIGYKASAGPLILATGYVCTA